MYYNNYIITNMDPSSINKFKEELTNLLIGKTVEDGNNICNEYNLFLRVIVTNGDPTITGPTDYTPTRVNISIMHGKIKSVVYFG